MVRTVCIVAVGLLVMISCTHDNDDTSRCELKPETGPCFGLITKYYYDKEEQKCKEFVWGGCEGVVPFDTLEECIACD